MSAFDEIIGYESIKNELRQVCDIMKNKEVYTKLGATQPRGILLHGDPGMGKTLMAKSLIKESGLCSYTVRRNVCTKEFLDVISSTFAKAKENAPSIVFLDDMDKFASEDSGKSDAQEYVAVQAGIDEVKDDDVFVIATVNDIDLLPDSLIRPGRFDKIIEVCNPTSGEAAELIKHYLKDKVISDDVNLEDVAMMINYNSCAELEVILNEAALSAAFAKRPCVTMKDLTRAVLKMEYETPESYYEVSDEMLRKTALHEAGHLVVSEVLCPGSVGFATLNVSGENQVNGFVRRCKYFDKRPYRVLVPLGGKAAVELYYADTVASGCQSDIKYASSLIFDGVTESGTNGLEFIKTSQYISGDFNSKVDTVVHSELIRYFRKAKDILLKNREFLEKTTEMLSRKRLLLYSDIRKIRESCLITSVEV